MKHAMKHELSQELAKKALQSALDSYRVRFPNTNPQYTWVTDTRVQLQFDWKALSVKGTVDVEPKQIVFDLEVPFLLRPFKNQAIEMIENQIIKWSEKAKTGQLG